MNYDFVTDRLAIGTTPETVADLSPFTHVIDCRAELDIAAMIRGTWFADHYLYAPTGDFSLLHRTHKPVDWFKKGVEFALPVLSQPHTKLYVFCHAGANRSPSMSYTILRALGLTSAQCFGIIDLGRFVAIEGLIACGWWRDGEIALKTLGYI